MVGSAITRILTAREDVSLVLRDRTELDLCNQSQVQAFFKAEPIDAVYLAAAKVGGIHANNTYPADFIFENLSVQSNVIHSAFQAGVNKLLFLGSSCIYPREAEQPINERQLLSGYLEPTNEPYAIAKIAGIKMCQAYNKQHSTDYRSVMPTNLYGPGDNFHSENSHVVPALLRRFHEAKIANSEAVVLWGSGTPFREFLHVDDMARACITVMETEQSVLHAKLSSELGHINVGTGLDCTIKELAETIATVVGFNGRLEWDTSRPDGTPRKLLDISEIKKLGWAPEIALRDGLVDAYQWFQDNAT